MLVVEDIDCFRKPSGKDGDFSLSWFLGFVDWMWASTGEDRVLVFTAKKKDRVDSVLLQPGRVDMCLPMGYCRASGFKILAWNHHEINEHWRFREIEGLLEEVEVTPAEVGEELMRSEDVDVALDSLVQFLHRKGTVESGVENGGGFSGEGNRQRTPSMG
ncbi:AAA-ATPase At3g50940-like, partial [Dendrobium catenatum]|uniref:AAA-ATPase At3g50940-like n=1 Tax=Dendrobium catenatum TaxID=906689 RepID=UPI0009F66AA0